LSGLPHAGWHRHGTLLRPLGVTSARAHAPLWGKAQNTSRPDLESPNFDGDHP
jgi:hypothetical protein